ncbi:hypothetical protein CYY_010199 [Polysphondylium violaceum]|uniref:MADS-box domain-containing protein n=1 Tax=Polysphondylium violaceum TaxID=133409 RepID=A0A8J4V212_9MYCE|nr:hypothetical protein CYY_010199 [Polysphondylium violaceum]
MSLSQLQMGPNTGLFQNGNNNNPSSPTSTPSSLTPNSNEDLKKEDTSEPDSPSGESSTSKKAGRRKIKIEFIDDKSRRHITFSKRKAGIMKKAYELSTLTGTQVLLLVASETGHVYTFATAKLQPLITRPEGKNLIQSCLNTPDNPTSPTIPVPQQTPPQQNIRYNNDPLMMGGYPSNPESLYNQDNSIQDKELERRQIKEQQKQIQQQQNNSQQQNYIQPSMSSINGLDMGGLGYSPSYMGFYPTNNVQSRYIQNNSSASSSPASPNQFNYPHPIPLNQYGGPC